MQEALVISCDKHCNIYLFQCVHAAHGPHGRHAAVSVGLDLRTASGLVVSAAALALQPHKHVVVREQTVVSVTFFKSHCLFG